MTSIDLGRFAESPGSVPSGMAANMVESASVCLGTMGHSSPTSLHLVTRSSDSVERQKVTVLWERVPKRVFTFRDDLPVATEQGAYAVALLLAEATLGYVAYQQSRKGTGFDFWLTRSDSDDINPLEDSLRLEVSGILQGSLSDVDSRVKRKLTQLQTSFRGVNGAVVVVAFGGPHARVELVAADD